MNAVVTSCVETKKGLGLDVSSWTSSCHVAVLTRSCRYWYQRCMAEKAACKLNGPKPRMAKQLGRPLFPFALDMNMRRILLVCRGSSNTPTFWNVAAATLADHSCDKTTPRGYRELSN